MTSGTNRDDTPPGQITRDQLVAYLDALLEAGKGRDFGPNGLQVEGRPEIRKVVTGVSACLELFERAREAGADAVVVHHGIFWDGMPRTLTGFQYRRVAALMASGMSLLAYHLPLDRHPELGNNAVAARRFGLDKIEPFGSYDGLPLGFKGRFEEPVPAAELPARIQAVYGQALTGFLSGPDPVRTLGIVSGGGQREVYTAIAEGLDAYVTGEAGEWVMNVVREAGIHYFAAGHYATELFGVQVLGEHLAQRFGIEVEFVDIPNPV
jgi:dinuclear metal center YbgI/SA1388 family protein